MDNMSGAGGAAYVASRNKAGGCKCADYSMPKTKKLSPMNKAEMATVKKDAARHAPKGSK